MLGAFEILGAKSFLSKKTKRFVLRMFQKYFGQIIHRAKPGLKEGMQDWLDLL
jgi:hypothetical protein